MKAVCWMGKEKMSVENVPDPQDTQSARRHHSNHPHRHLRLGPASLRRLHSRPWSRATSLATSSWAKSSKSAPAFSAEKLKVGDRVVVPFTIACGNCFFCEQQLWSCCDNSNPNYWIAEKFMGYSPSGLFGYSHMTGGYAGGQAQYARVPFADVGPMKVPEGIPDEKLLFLTDIFPTGYMGAENCNIQPGDTVAIWGAGPVAQFAIRSAFMLGAERVIALTASSTACRWRATAAQKPSTTSRWIPLSRR